MCSKLIAQDSIRKNTYITAFVGYSGFNDVSQAYLTDTFPFKFLGTYDGHLPSGSLYLNKIFIAHKNHTISTGIGLGHFGNLFEYKLYDSFGYKNATKQIGKYRTKLFSEFIHFRISDQIRIYKRKLFLVTDLDYNFCYLSWLNEYNNSNKLLGITDGKQIYFKNKSCITLGIGLQKKFKKNAISFNYHFGITPTISIQNSLYRKWSKFGFNYFYYI